MEDFEINEIDMRIAELEMEREKYLRGIGNRYYRLRVAKETNPLNIKKVRNGIKFAKNKIMELTGKIYNLKSGLPEDAPPPLLPNKTDNTFSKIMAEVEG